MEYELRFQDPSALGTRYLYEEIIDQLLDPRSIEVESIFAFASYNACLGLLQDPALRQFVARDHNVLRLLVGTDAITDRRTLELLRDAERSYHPYIEVKVYKNRQSGLFHPKLVRAHRDDGSGVVIVGSGNMTPGGFRYNIEAYSVLRYEAAAPVDESQWDQFLISHRDEITEIDLDALERGERNAERAQLGRRIAQRRGRRGGLRTKRGAVAEEIIAEPDGAITVDDTVPQPADRMLVAEVPSAGGRWHQVHFNEDVARTYFRARPATADRIFLMRYESAGMVVPEPPRPVVMPPRNRNHRIEFGARPGAAFPAGGRPILVLRELGVRTHIYQMLFPGESGYSEMAALLAAQPSVGRGVPRVITTRAQVLAAWPGVPI